MVALVSAWAQLFGLISFELFGQFTRVVEAREELFRHAVHELGRSVGLLDGRHPGGGGGAAGAGA